MAAKKYRWMFYQNTPFVLMKGRAYFYELGHLVSTRFDTLTGTIPDWADYYPAEEDATDTELKNIAAMLR